MKTFDKIKTASDKRLALEKRGKAVAVDYKPGDKLYLSEKLDGFNVSLDTQNKRYSRKNQLGGDMTHHQKLIPFMDVADHVHEVMGDYFKDNHDYQVFGEFMVTDRLIQYDDDLYNKWYIFDIYDLTDNKYLGPNEAVKFANYLLEADSKFENMVIPLSTIADSYEFTNYEDLERFVYDKSLDSSFNDSGQMEGIVAYGLDSGIRAKIVNKEFKESQRTVTSGKGHTKAVQWLNQYLTEPRVQKLVKNAVIEGDLDSTRDDYFTTQLETMSDLVWQDILEEATDVPEFKGNDLKNIHNKIEAKTRFVMLDEKRYDLESALGSLESDLVM